MGKKELIYFYNTYELNVYETAVIYKTVIG